MVSTRLDLERIRTARHVIDPVFLDTPLYPCDALGRALGCAVSIKLETANPVRSFKGRGTELVASLLRGQRATAAVCASAGNLGWALGWSGRRHGLDVTVVAARRASAAKLDRIRALGTALELVDGDHEMARQQAAAIAQRRGIRLVEDSLDVETCEGAATIGLELVDRATSADAVLVALGGAMATGVGHVLRALRPDVEVICVQPRGAPAMTRSWHERRVITTDTADTIADGVAGRHPIPEVLDDLLQVADDAVLVGETSIIPGIRMLWEHAGLVVEPPRRWAWPPCWRTPAASPAVTWSPSSAAATSTWPSTNAGSAHSCGVCAMSIPAMAEIRDADRSSALAARQDDGFVVPRAVLSDAELAAARAHADHLLRGVSWSDNDFDGRRSGGVLVAGPRRFAGTAAAPRDASPDRRPAGRGLPRLRGGPGPAAVAAGICRSVT